MKVPFSWLKEYVEINCTPEELAAKLVKSGFEVESIEDLGNGIKNVFTCKITKIERHPDADRLQICHIDLGAEQSVIITAATNVFEGAIVPAAVDGAWLVGGKRIFKAPLRGIMSNGMFCSGSELGVDNSVIDGAEVDGILILPADTPLGQDIKDVLGMNEVVLDISVTSNRPDCQSILGIARETSAILGLPLKMPNFSYKTQKKKTEDYLTVDVQAPELCPDYYGAVVTNVVIADSPKWMKKRLSHVGIRSINTVVDITNYVLTEIGQPMHAFDMRYIDGAKITVRRAREQERAVTLDAKEFTLNPDNLVIADTSKTIGLAGIMGGLDSEVKPDTVSIAFEAARFARDNIRRSSRALGQRSASSARFERGVDVGTTRMGMSRALALIDELKCGKIIGEPLMFDAKPVAPRIIDVEIDRVNRLLGITVPTADMAAILTSLDIKVTQNKKSLTLEIPLNRDDLENYTDIAEEIIRIYGYEHIKSTLPVVQAEAAEDSELDLINRLKSALVGLGCYETMTYSFVEPTANDKLGLHADDSRRNCIVLNNPISEDLSVMRTSMAHNVLTTASYNLNRKNFNFRLFEISRVFIPESLPLTASPREETHLTVTVCGEKESFFTLKGILNETASVLGTKFGIEESKEVFLHPGKSADVMAKGKRIGYFGAVHPQTAARYEIGREVYFAEICLDSLLQSKIKDIKFAPLPKFQEMERDIALTVRDEVKAGDMQRAIARECGAILESVNVFDVYKGKQIADGYKSIAFKLIFRAPDRTLVEEEVSKVMTKLEAAMAAKFDSKIRQ